MKLKISLLILAFIVSMNVFSQSKYSDFITELTMVYNVQKENYYKESEKIMKKYVKKDKPVNSDYENSGYDTYSCQGCIMNVMV